MQRWSVQTLGLRARVRNSRCTEVFSMYLYVKCCKVLQRLLKDVRDFLLLCDL